MCFAPQQRAPFRHLNLQKWSEHVVLLNAFNMFNSKAALRHNGVHFFNNHLQKWSKHVVLLTHQNVLRATTAFAFSTSKLPKVLRTRCALHIVTSKCASRHNGVQVLISHTTRWLRTRHFSESTCRPSGATNPWKNTVFRDFPTFSRTLLFFLLSLSLL